MEFSLTYIAIWFVAIVVASLSLVIYLGSRNLSSRIFSLLTLLDAIWVASFVFLTTTTVAETATYIFRFQFLIGSVIAAVFLVFALSYPEDRKPKSIIVSILALLHLIYLPVYLFTNWLIVNSYYVGGAQQWGFTNGFLMVPLFNIPFFTMWAIGFYILFKKFKQAADARKKLNLKYIIIALMIGVTPPATFSVILAELGYIRFELTGPIASIGWALFMSYSIAKYRQMNIKAVAAEVFVLVMTVILFINIFARSALGSIGSVVTFVAFACIGLFFVRGVLKEAEQKEKLESLNVQLADLNKNLQQKVDEQTKEIKRAYEVEKKARVELEELDKAKDQFILTTQHHLRTPLTIIKGYLTVIKDHSDLPADVISATEKMAKSADILSSFINDLLQITELRVRKDNVDLNNN